MKNNMSVAEQATLFLLPRRNIRIVCVFPFRRGNFYVTRSI